MKGRALFLLRAALVVGGAVLLLWMPLLNRYPLVYSDSGTYLWSAAELFVPVDRLVGYGLFIRAASLVPSLWAIVAVQALGTSYLLFRAAELILGKTVPWDKWQTTASRIALNRALAAFGVVAATALFTSASQFVGWVMPDVLASWLLLGAIVLWLAPTKLERGVAVLLLGLALIAHNSHIWIAVGTFGAVAIGVLLVSDERRQTLRTLVPFALVLVGGVVLSLGINVWLGAGATLGRGGSTFVLNRMNETGILQQTLDTYCGTESWTLCQYRDTLNAHEGEQGWFLWNTASPLQVTGWDSTDPEQGAIVQHALWCCFGQVADVSLRSSLIHFWSIQPEDDLLPLDDKSETQRAMRELYPRELAAFLADGQEQRTPPLPLLQGNDLLGEIVWLGIGVILFVVAFRRGDKEWMVLWFALLTLLIVNAAVTGSLSGLYARLQARVFWLVPFFVLLDVAALWLGYRAGQRAAERECVNEPLETAHP